MSSTPKPRRSMGLEGIKLLMGTGAMAAAIGLWSVFANRDHMIDLANQTAVGQTELAAIEIILCLPPVPTLVPFNAGQGPMPTSQPSALSLESLRSVSAPAQTSSNPAAPRVVPGGGNSGGVVTTTRSS